MNKQNISKQKIIEYSKEPTFKKQQNFEKQQSTNSFIMLKADKNKNKNPKPCQSFWLRSIEKCHRNSILRQHQEHRNTHERKTTSEKNQ